MAQQIIIGLIFLNAVVLIVAISTLREAMKIIKQSKLK
jgi:hypothetical protein